MKPEVTVNQIIDIYDFVIGNYGETLTVTITITQKIAIMKWK